MLPLHCHEELPGMTKSELQVALAAAADTNKRTAGVFLDTLSALAYKEIKKNGEFVLPGFDSSGVEGRCAFVRGPANLNPSGARQRWMADMESFLSLQTSTRGAGSFISRGRYNAA
jgi:hypothetical protein